MAKILPSLASDRTTVDNLLLSATLARELSGSDRMRGTGIILDDRGNVWPAATRDLARSLNCDLAPTDLNDFVIRNLGFVQVTLFRGGVRIRLRPDILSPAAYVSLRHWLADHPHHRAILTTFGDGWQDELAGTTEKLHQALAIFFRQSSWRAGKQFHRARLNPATLAPDSPLRTFRGLWEHGLGAELKSLISLCDRHFKGRFTLSEVTTADEFVIREHGRGYAVYPDDYFTRCIGQRIEDDPDMEYGRWIAEAHRQALTEREPLLEDVDVAICGAGQPGQHVRYQRIIAPLCGAKGQRYLLSASVLGSVEPMRAEGARG